MKDFVDFTNEKRNLGQYYTTTNPFHHNAFKLWSQKANLFDNNVLEPFAGSNNLIKMLLKDNSISSYTSYDINPTSGEVLSRDTLLDFPRGFHVAITNPPYLAKNSAKRRGLFYPVSEYDDLYKHSLDIMLRHVSYVAAIVPDSLLTSGLFRERASDFITLNTGMFDDTEHPVCLALFGEEIINGGPLLWLGEKKVGRLDELEKTIPNVEQGIKWKFNDPSGYVGLKALDSPKGKTISFVRGEEIDSKCVKVSARALTRISAPDINIKKADDIIDCANSILFDIRKKTSDMLLTSFKGLRQDGHYRKRLDFKLARSILNASYNQVC